MMLVLEKTIDEFRPFGETNFPTESWNFMYLRRKLEVTSIQPIYQQPKASSILFFVHMYICFQRWPHIYGNTCKLDLDNYYTHILSKAVHKSYNLFWENIDHVFKVFQGYFCCLPLMCWGLVWCFNEIT